MGLIIMAASFTVRSLCVLLPLKGEFNLEDFIMTSFFD